MDKYDFVPSIPTNETVMTTPTTTHRIHNLADLKALIKGQAAEGRSLRVQAQATSGPDRHDLKCQANEIGSDTRTLLLAYGFLKGRTFEQMESPYSDPEAVPYASPILSIAKPYFNKGPDASEEKNQADWDAFTAKVEADRKAWVKQLRISQAGRDALRRKKAAALKAVA